MPTQQPDTAVQTSIRPPESQPEEEDFLDIDFGAASEALIGQAEGGAAASVAQMIEEAQQQGDDYDEETSRALAGELPIGGVSALKKQYKMQDHFAQDASAPLPIFIQRVKESLFTNGTTAKLSREALSAGFSLADKDTQISFESANAEIWEFDVQEKGDATPKKSPFNPAQIREFRRYLDTLPSEERKRQCINALYNSLNRNDALESGDLRRYIVRIVDGMDTATLEAMEGAVPVYAKRIQTKIEALLDEHREKTFNTWIETNEVVCEPLYSLPKFIDPLDATTSMIKSLYEGEAPMNNFEDKVINHVAGLDNVLWWHRVQERKPNEFFLNGYINHYPDFIVRTKSGMTV